jgi:CRISPR/Cas system-associated exonuclease Cas4 (RecB family)
MEKNQMSFTLGKAKKTAKIPESKNVPAAANRFFAKKNPYDPGSRAPFSLSRSKVDMFLKCPRCFYLEQRLGVKIPSGPGFSLNSAVDYLLKKEFDVRRAQNEVHPLMKAYGIKAVPARHKNLENWRNNFRGIRFLHKATNFDLFGAIDDLWLNEENEYHIVDYKATSTTHAITLEDQWKQWYKKQAEFYQWLFRRNGFDVSELAYFVFCNATKDRAAFDGKLEFEVTIVEHKGDDSWIEPTVSAIKDCLESSVPPASNPDCEYCAYIEKAKKVQ